MSQFVRIPPKDVGMRLDRWLRARLPNTPQSLIAKLIRKQAIRIATKAPPTNLSAGVAWQHAVTEISTRLDVNAFVMMPAELASTAVSHTPPSASHSSSASARHAHSPPAAVDFGVGLSPASQSLRSHSQSQQQQRQSNAELSADAQARLRSWVLFADEHVIAINKPPKLPVQGGPGVHRALTDWLHYLQDHPATVNDECVRILDAPLPAATSPGKATTPATAGRVRHFASSSAAQSSSEAPPRRFDSFGGVEASRSERGTKNKSASARLLASLSADEQRLFTAGVIKRRAPSPAWSPPPTLSPPPTPPSASDAALLASKATTRKLASTAKPLLRFAVPKITPPLPPVCTLDLDAPEHDARFEVPRLVHRLDAETSGVLLLARSRRAAQRFTDMFREHAYEKLYWAVVEGVPSPSAGIVDVPLVNLAADGSTAGADSDGIGAEAQSALTEYRTIAANERASSAWLEMRPRTGRKHQLRRHALALGCAIVGDKKHAPTDALPDQAARARRECVYQALGVANPTLHLHARSIRFRHPFVAGREIEITAAPPTHMTRSLRALKFEVPAL